MEIKNIKKPYTVYDIMAYFIPATVLIFGFIVFFYHNFWQNGLLKKNYNGIFISVNKYVFQIKNHWPTEWFELLLVSIIFMIITYVIGHVISSLSSMLIDSFVIKRVKGYPFTIMLNSKFPNTRFEKYKRFFSQSAHGYFLLTMGLYAARLVPINIANYSGLFCLTLLLCRLTFATYPRHQEYGILHELLLVIRFIGFFLVLLFFTAFLYIEIGKQFGIKNYRISIDILGASIFIGMLILYYWPRHNSSPRMKIKTICENQIKDIKELLGKSSTNNAPDLSITPISLLQYIVLAICLVPATIGYIIYYFGVKPFYGITGIYQPMSKKFQELFCICCQKTFLDIKCEAEKGCPLKEDLYWLTLNFVTDKSELHYYNIRHWLNLYGFARNLCMSFFILFLIYSLFARTTFSEVKNYPIFYWWPLVAGFLSAILLHRYTYLYYRYYSKYIARAFVTVVTLQKQQTEDSCSIIAHF